MTAENQSQCANPAAISSWVRQWHRQLQRFLKRRSVTDADAQDLAQEVYLRLLRFDGVELIRQPQAYLCKIAAHVACDWQLESRQSKPHSSEALDELIAEDTMAEALDAERRRQRLHAALQNLPANMRTALTLQYRDGLSYEEIAKQMNASLRSVRRYIEEGYIKLRQQLGASHSGDGS
jgi:RNA polymerase sigma factor (sigma-70 family)